MTGSRVRSASRTARRSAARCRPNSTSRTRSAATTPSRSLRPGLDRPLFTRAHFERFAGQTAKVTLKLPQDGRRRLTGAIARIEGDQITFLVDGAEFTTAVDNIDKARLVPDWAALGLAPTKPGGKRRQDTTQSDKPTNKPAADKPTPAE